MWRELVSTLLPPALHGLEGTIVTGNQHLITSLSLSPFIHPSPAVLDGGVNNAVISQGHAVRAAEVHLGLDGRGTNSGGCMPENVEQFLKTDNEMRVL